ncbi:MAG: hypothetical protein DHS20C20_21350 [Ardenticatenaceae bacterium]|nr:MAG: hypothetical protein DHS20C20_21350 [Ardenticatenaceae bacterium]
MNNDVNEFKSEERSSKGGNSSTVMALVFIVVGVLLIASNITGFEFENWWVLFMFIPAALFAKNIFDDYQMNGRITARSTGAIIASLAILLTAATFLFEAITWGMIWPVGLIFAGIAIFLGNRS